MKKITKFAAIGTGALLLVGSFTACSHKYRDPEYRANKMVERISSEMELNEAQKAKLVNLSKEMMDTRKAMKERFSSSHDSMKAMLEQPKLEQEKILKMVREHTQMMNERAPAIVAAMAEVYDSLTPEQRAKLREHMEKMEKHHHRFSHHG